MIDDNAGFVDQLLGSGFVVALAGVLIGGAITIASTLIFERRRELSHRRNLATGLTYRITLLTLELGDIRKQICRAIGAARGAGVVEKDYWASVPALIGTPEKAIEVHVDESGWMQKKQHVELSMDVIQLIRNYNLSVALMSRYNKSREEVEIATAEHTNFRITPQGIVGEVGFDIRQHSNLCRMILTTNQLLLELEKTLNETWDTVPGINERLNSAMPEYFPRKYFKLKLQLIDQKVKANAG